MSSKKVLAEKVLIAAATYNERENIIDLVPQILSVIPNADVLVVDDNSPDGTGEWAMEYAKTEPRLTAVIRKNERGLGSAVLAAMRYALENGYDYFINLDADFSHPVEKIPVLLARACAEGADVVIGSRYIRGGKIIGWPAKRQIMSRLINGYARIMLGLTTRDNSGAFRCYSCGRLRDLVNGPILSSGYSFFEEVLYRIKKAGGKFAEEPITFTERQKGESKINRKEAVRALVLLAKLGKERIFGQ